MSFSGDTSGKESPPNAGDAREGSLILGSGKIPGVGNGAQLLYSCLENSMGRGIQKAIYGAAKSRTQLSKHTHKPYIITLFDLILISNH